MRNQMKYEYDDILVSVVMSNFNTEEDYLRSSIKSILNQTHRKLELIIIDDFSDCPPDSLIADFRDERIVYIKNEENLGLAVSLNKGLKAARGKYIVRIDTDDIALPNRIDEQIMYMEQNTECDIAGTRVYIEDVDGKIHKGSAFYGKDEKVGCELLFDCVLIHPSVIIRKSFLDNKGISYNPIRRRTQDYDLWVRSYIAGANIHVMKKALLIKRDRPSRASVVARNTQLGVVKELHKLELETFFKKEISEEELMLHEQLCIPYQYQGDCKKVKEWIRFLYDNTEASLYKGKTYLKRSIVKKMAAYLVCQLRNHKLSIIEAMSFFYSVEFWWLLMLETGSSLYRRLMFRKL